MPHPREEAGRLTLGIYRPSVFDAPLSVVFPDWDPDTKILNVTSKYPRVAKSRTVLTVNHWTRRFYVVVSTPKEKEQP